MKSNTGNPPPPYFRDATMLRSTTSDLSTKAPIRCKALYYSIEDIAGNGGLASLAVSDIFFFKKEI